MANRIFNDVQQWSDDDGTPLDGGKITFYEPGTVTLKDTYTDSSISTAHANPVILDSNGRPTSPIWLNGAYKYKVTTSTNVPVGLTIDNLNKEASTVETGLIITNGSFEVDSESDGQPDDWIISPLVSATIAIDTADSAHGKNSLLFTSGGSGGGTATSNRFDVIKGGNIAIEFTHKSSSATALTKVDIKTYDKDDIALSTLSAYSEGAANPTSYSTEHVAVTADPTAVTAEIVITGIDTAGTTKTAGTTMNIDGLSVETSLRAIIEEILDRNGNEVLALFETASAVNYFSIANNTAGNPPDMVSKGPDTDIDVLLNGKGTGVLKTNGERVHGMVILDTPELLINNTTPPTTATAVNSTTLNTADATIAILSVQLDNDAATSLYFASATFSSSSVYEKVQITTNAQTVAEFTIKLDSNNDFWWLSSDGTISSTLNIYLIGYYV